MSQCLSPLPIDRTFFPCSGSGDPEHLSSEYWARAFERVFLVLTFLGNGSEFCSGVVTLPSQGLREDTVSTASLGRSSRCHLGEPREAQK